MTIVLSIFREHQLKNRKIYDNYYQIYLKSILEELLKRNNKLVYSRKNVVGKDIKFKEPINSDLIINNDFNKNIDIKLKSRK